MSKISFVTGNNHKVQELQKVIDAKNIDIQIERIKDDIEEIQSSDIKKIALRKAKQSYAKFKVPLFCEDSGIFIEALDGFPSANAKFVFKKIGLKGILKLMEGKINRKAYMQTAICYLDENEKSHVFEGKMNCTLSETIRGTLGFGYDPIIIPCGYTKTLGEDDSKKHILSARAKAFEKFIEYFKNIR